MRWGAALLALVAFACGSGEDPTAFLVYDLDPASHSYRLTRSTIETLTNPQTGNGRIAKLRGGGSLRVTLGNPESEAEWQEALTMHGDDTPAIVFDVNAHGVAIPWDLDSAMMLTLYHHLEKAAFAFEELGVAHAQVRKLPVYYFAQLRIPFFFFPIPLLTDNAAYLVTLDAFLIPPRYVLDDVPLYANRGVVAHEYAHAVFNRLVNEDRRVPAYLLTEWPTEPVNALRSLDEGLADFFAAVFTDDPAFLAASLPGEIAEERDLRTERHYDLEMQLEVAGAGTTEYDPYALGTVIASMLWALGDTVSRPELAAAVVRTLGATRATTAFQLVQFFDTLHGELPVGSRATACQLFHARLDAVAGELTCPLP